MSELYEIDLGMAESYAIGRVSGYGYFVRCTRQHDGDEPPVSPARNVRDILEYIEEHEARYHEVPFTSVDHPFNRIESVPLPDPDATRELPILKIPAGAGGFLRAAVDAVGPTTGGNPR